MGLFAVNLILKNIKKSLADTTWQNGVTVGMYWCITRKAKSQKQVKKYSDY